MIRLLGPLLAAFKMWMFIDAMQRRAPRYWLMVIWLPFGAVVYFFKVKIHDYRQSPLWGKISGAVQRPADVRLLRQTLETSPSIDNTLYLAQALYDQGEFEESSELFERALEKHAHLPEALYGRGLARLAVDDLAPAIASFQELMEVDEKYQDYAAWPQLGYALKASGRIDACLELMQRLVESSPRINHQLFYAHFLSEDGRRAEACEVLELALTEHDAGPAFIRRRNRKHARDAKKMLRELSSSTNPAAGG